MRSLAINKIHNQSNARSHASCPARDPHTVVLTSVHILSPFSFSFKTNCGAIMHLFLFSFRNMCSRDEIIMYSEPVLFPSIPITYVITTEGSDRYKQLLHELNTYKPTRKVVIVYHKSMTDCARPHWIKRASQDLWNNNLMIAKRDPNVPVLILEDDVHFLPRVHDYAKCIDETVANNKCELYSLGIACFLCFPLIHPFHQLYH